MNPIGIFLGALAVAVSIITLVGGIKEGEESLKELNEYLEAKRKKSNPE